MENAYISRSGSWFNPAWFALDTSRAFESAESKFFMRSTVVISEALIYLPAVYYFARITYRNNATKKVILIHAVIVLFIKCMT